MLFKKQEETREMHFNTLFQYLTDTNKYEILCTFFCTKSLKSNGYFTLKILQVLSSHMQLAATVLDSTGLDSNSLSLLQCVFLRNNLVTKSKKHPTLNL